MSAWVCPNCGGVIKSTSQHKLDKWVSNHRKSCPRPALKAS